MDTNAIYQLLVTLLIGIGAPCLSWVIGKKEKSAWGIKAKMENEFFFALIMLFSLVEALFVAFLYTLIQGLLMIWCKININTIISLLLYVGLMFFCIRFHIRRNFIRKRLLGCNKSKAVLVCMPLIIICITLLFLFLKLNTLLITCVYISFFATEILGLAVFRGRYTKYAYSFAKITLTPRWIIIMCEDKEIRVKADRLESVEYYGEPKIILHKKKAPRKRIGER